MSRANQRRMICCVMGLVNSCWICSDARSIGRYKSSQKNSIWYTQYQFRYDSDPIIICSLPRTSTVTIIVFMSGHFSWSHCKQAHVCLAFSGSDRWPDDWKSVVLCPGPKPRERICIHMSRWNDASLDVSWIFGCQRICKLALNKHAHLSLVYGPQSHLVCLIIATWQSIIHWVFWCCWSIIGTTRQMTVLASTF